MLRTFANFKTLGLLAVVLLAAVVSRSVFPSANAADQKAEDPLAKVEPFEIPPGDPETLFDYIEELVEPKQKFDSEEEQHEFQLRAMVTSLAVADRVLKEKELSDEDAERAAQLRIQALVNLGQMGVKDGSKKAIDAILTMQKDSRKVVADFAKNNERLVKIICISGLDDKGKDALIAETLSDLKERKYAQRVLNQAQLLGESLGESGDRDRMLAYYTELAKGMRGTGREALVDQAERIEGQLRRLQLPGNFMEISGTQLDGKKFDWAAYRGKVVLVDFWATWCQPCLMELPNVKKAYRKWHDKGFDVVGISLDEDLDRLTKFIKDQKLPWVTLVEPEEENRHWNNPIAKHYGVSGIPTAILVDKEGKVVSLSARGEELSDLLEQLLGGKE